LVVAWRQRCTNLCQEESPLVPDWESHSFQSKHPSNFSGIKEHCSVFGFIWYSKLNERHIHKLTIVYEKNNVRLIISIFCQSCVLCRVFACIVHFCHCALSIYCQEPCLLSIGLYCIVNFHSFCQHKNSCPLFLSVVFFFSSLSVS